jgi:hypothetical protein
MTSTETTVENKFADRAAGPRYSARAKEKKIMSSSDISGQGSPPPENLKAAFKAFKKRLKLTRLDEESALGGRNATTSGRSSGIVAITPPNQFPPAVWEELVKQGKLKKAGHGTYELVE